VIADPFVVEIIIKVKDSQWTKIDEKQFYAQKRLKVLECLFLSITIEYRVLGPRRDTERFLINNHYILILYHGTFIIGDIFFLRLFKVFHSKDMSIAWSIKSNNDSERRRQTKREFLHRPTHFMYCAVKDILFVGFIVVGCGVCCSSAAIRGGCSVMEDDVAAGVREGPSSILTGCWRWT